MSLVYLGLGSNLGDKRKSIKKALALIEKMVGDIIAHSGLYETQPWGYDSLEVFLNMAVGVETNLKPEELLLVTENIERKIGRRKKSVTHKYQDRIIDIDILLYDNLILQTPKLIIPHPLMHRREFVLKPMLEIAPDFIHPVSGKTIAELYNLYL